MGRKIIKFPMTHELLSNLLNDRGLEINWEDNIIIKDIKVIGVEQSLRDSMDGIFYIYMEHDNLPELGEGDQVPIVYVYRRTS